MATDVPASSSSATIPDDMDSAPINNEDIDMEIDTSAQPLPETEEEEPVPLPAGSDPKLQSRKDITLRDFLSKMDDYAPIVSPYRALDISNNPDS
jgi:hypothetical protein